MEVRPLIIPNINWKDYLAYTTSSTGRCPTRDVDSSNRKLSDYGKYIASLAEFRDGGLPNIQDTLKDPGALARQLQFGFIFIVPTSVIFKSMELTDLDFVSAKSKEEGRVAIVSGTLDKWRVAVIECCSMRHRLPALRATFNTCLGYFEQLGLADLWSDYRKKQVKEEGTYLLEYKGK